jgi:hypothetical protein
VMGSGASWISLKSNCSLCPRCSGTRLWSARQLSTRCCNLLSCSGVSLEKTPVFANAHGAASFHGCNVAFASRAPWIPSERTMAAARRARMWRRSLVSEDLRSPELIDDEQHMPCILTPVMDFLASTPIIAQTRTAPAPPPPQSPVAHRA